MLSNIKVLDMTRILAGPYCSMLLGDLGANIYKIERPGIGDDTRSWGPPFHQGESCYFQSVNRNKKSIAVNFKKPEGSNIIKNLASKCDVLIENFLPGHLKKFDLDYMSLKKVNPQLIYCSLTGYGQKGFLAKRPGYDVIIASVGGLLGITGPKDGEPCRVGVALTDISTGLYAYASILAALLSRFSTGVGTHIDANLLSTQTAFLSHIAANWLNCGVEGSRWGTGHASIVPYQCFLASDGRYVVVGAGNDEAFKLLCNALKLPELLSNEKFLSNASRVQHREELVNLLQENFSKGSSKHWESVFANVDVPFGCVNSISEAMKIAQAQNPFAFLTLKNDRSQSVCLPAPAVKFSRQHFDRESHTFPPRLGENTMQVLQDELYLTTDQLEDLKTRNVIFQSE